MNAPVFHTPDDFTPDTTGGSSTVVTTAGGAVVGAVVSAFTGQITMPIKAVLDRATFLLSAYQAMTFMIAGRAKPFDTAISAPDAEDTMPCGYFLFSCLQVSAALSLLSVAADDTGAAARLAAQRIPRRANVSVRRNAIQPRYAPWGIRATALFDVSVVQVSARRRGALTG
jgi:hypothetical protein